MIAGLIDHSYIFNSSSMIRLFKNIVVYGILILLVLEGLVRIFHLHNDLPERYVAKDGMLKWIPGQNGYTVYGNRRQNFAEYHINNSGYNSYREFRPTDSKTEVAIIGDSYIEGFHQNYYNSIGKQVESKLNDVEVYEYGHSSNDLADQLYLIYANQEKFDKVDYVILYMKYENDLQRPEYEFIPREPLFPLLRHSKLVVYLLNIGILDPVKNLHQKVNSLKSGMLAGGGNQDETSKNKPKIDRDSLYLENFKSLVSKYGFDKSKTAILLDSRATNSDFLAYLKQENINVIDFAVPFKEAGGHRRTTLIYDHHWNHTGRKVIATEISTYLQKVLPKQ